VRLSRIYSLDQLFRLQIGIRIIQIQMLTAILLELKLIRMVIPLVSILELHKATITSSSSTTTLQLAGKSLFKIVPQISKNLVVVITLTNRSNQEPTITTTLLARIRILTQSTIPRQQVSSILC